MDWPYLNVSAGLFHCLQERHACMWLTVIYVSSPSRQKNPIGFRNGEYKTWNWLWLVNQIRTKTARKKLTYCQTTTNLGCSDLSWRYVGFLHDGAEVLEGLWPHTMRCFPCAAPGRAALLYWFGSFLQYCIVLLSIYHTQYWNSSMYAITVCHKTTTFVPNGALATLQYSICDTVMWYGTVL